MLHFLDDAQYTNRTGAGAPNKTITILASEPKQDAFTTNLFRPSPASLNYLNCKNVFRSVKADYSNTAGR